MYKHINLLFCKNYYNHQKIQCFHHHIIHHPILCYHHIMRHIDHYKNKFLYHNQDINYFYQAWHLKMYKFHTCLMMSKSYNQLHIISSYCFTNNIHPCIKYILFDFIQTNIHHIGHHISNKLKLNLQYLNIDSFYQFYNQCNHHSQFNCHHHILQMESKYYRYNLYNYKHFNIFLIRNCKISMIRSIHNIHSNTSIFHLIMLEGSYIQYSCLKYTLYNCWDIL